MRTLASGAIVLGLLASAEVVHATLETAAGPRVAPGVRVRLTPADSYEIGGVARRRSGSFSTIEKVVSSDDQFVTFASGLEGTLTLPRVSTPFVGTLVGIDAGLVTIALEGRTAPLRIPRAAVSRLDVSQGRKKTVGRSAGRGFLIGAGAGALIGYAAGDERGGLGFLTPEQGALVGTVLLGAVGALVGTIAGQVERDVWRPIPIDGVRVSVAATRGGAGMSIAFGF